MVTMRRPALVFLITALAAIAWGGATAAQTPATPSALPVIVLDTAKGTIEIEVWPSEAPKSVAHILALVRRNFYRGLRFHWVNSAVAQVGDPATRDVTKKETWGLGGSGTKIGVEDYSKRKFARGSVGISHRDGAKNSDSQIFISKAANPNLDGKFIMIGRVTRGMEVVDKLVVTDVLRNATVK
jgi:cyclophilin family peptidyl-prolyl cis-trans isomerase